MRYENLLTRSLAILRRRPWLILLAFLAGESGGGGGGANFSLRGRPRPEAAPDLSWVPYWIHDRAAMLVAIGLAIVLLAVLLFLVSCVAAGAIVRGVAALDAGERVSFGGAWRMGLGSFWRVLGLRIVLFLLLVGPGLVLILPPLLGAAAGSDGIARGFLLDVPLFVAYLFWLFLISWVAILALRACVLDGRGPIGSFGSGFRLLRDQFPRVALTGAIFLGLGIIVGILAGVVLGLISAPFAVGLVVDLQAADWSALLRTAVTYLAVLVPVSLVINAAVGAYYSTFWTVAYRRLGVEGQIAEPVPLPA